MKKIVSILTVIALIAALACTSVFAEETAPVELGINDAESFDFENGNFEAVACDGSIHAKIYVNNTWTADTSVPAGMAIWMKENPEIQLDNDCDSQTMNLICSPVDSESYDGAATVEEMAKYIDTHEEMNVQYEICTINGIKAMVFNSIGKYQIGAYYELPEGLFFVAVDGITNEELENEAVLTVCSLTTEE